MAREISPGRLNRRGFVQLAAAAGAAAGGVASTASAMPSQTGDALRPQPSPDFNENSTTSDILVETLLAWGATHVFGIVGDGINSLIEALRKRQDRIRYIGVRHEEAAAFMASGFAKHSGRLGVCVGTTGPGAIHLMNGLYDAGLDGAPVVALTGLTFHDLRGVRYQQGIDTTRLMQGLAVYNEEVTGPEHALLVANRACRAALGDRGVAHLAISKDVQMMKLSADKRSTRNPGARSSSSWNPPLPTPPYDQLLAAANVLNAGSRIAVLAGQGALSAREEVTELADRLGAPVAKALLGKAVLADDSPFTTGGIGDLGTAPSSWIMRNCDTLLILGSTMPWEEYYPAPGQARGVQVDLKPDRLGLRYPVEVGLTGDVRSTLQALLPLLDHKSDRAFLSEAQQRMTEWNDLLNQVERVERTPLRPQMVIRAVSDIVTEDAVISLDCGANTHFAARCLRLRAGQRLTGTGMLASMASGLPFAIAAKLAFPQRQSVAIVGDGGFSMLMAELATAVSNELPVKIILLRNDSLAEVKFEQKEIGNPEYGCALAPIDFVSVAKACGADAFKCERPDEVRPAVQAALSSPRAAIVEAIVDANERPAKPDELKA
ncbi:MAG: twin-arginine translocation signal domain-containing protein [Hyphomicrobiales bacterium]|nr:twin-arginine translocation signal domain-containing protein [Hyphomicrobiales bacterium]